MVLSRKADGTAARGQRKGARRSDAFYWVHGLRVFLRPPSSRVADERALQYGYEIWNGSRQGKVHFVRGSNWTVVEVTAVATGEPKKWDLEGLAKELNAAYPSAGMAPG